MRSTLFLLLALTAIAFESYSQGTSNISGSTLGQEQVYTIEQLQEDYKIFRGSLEEMHPGIYWYQTKRDMDTYFEQGYESLNHPMTELEFERIIAPIISKIGCGHTWYWITQQLHDSLYSKGKLFPLKLKYLNDHVYCLQNNSNDSISIQIGNEILSINGYSMDSIVNIFNNFLGGDGFISTGKQRLSERGFMYFYPLYIDQSEMFHIEYVDGSGYKKEIDLKALYKKEIESNAGKYGVPKTEFGDHITLDFLNNSSTAVLKIKVFLNWKADKRKVKFEKELNKFFLKIDSSKINNLIIDLRDNDGGFDDYGLKLFSYFYDKPIIGFDKMEFKTKKSKYFKYSDMSRSKLWFLTSVKYRTKKINDSTFHFVNRKTLKLHDPSHPQFRGKVYILINGSSYSTTADFAALMRSYGLATFIGEETGGGYYGNTSAIGIKVKLPNTKVNMEVAFVRYTTNVSKITELGRGTMPDYQIVPSIQDVIKGVDTEMNFTLDLINDSEKN